MLPANASHAKVCSLQAFKSIAGHAEPAAGLSALAALCQDLSCQRLKGVVHLRDTNPHLDQLLSGSAGTGTNACAGAAHPFDVPRTERSRPITAAAVSSFAYQGSNAHCVVQRAAPGRCPAALPCSPLATTWERERCWVLGYTPHQSIVRAAPHRSTVQLRGHLASPPLSGLLDLYVNGTGVVPLSGWLEAAWAASSTLLATAPNPPMLAVSDCTSSFAVRQGRFPEAYEVSVDVSLHTGGIEVGASGATSPPVSHGKPRVVTATVARIVAATGAQIFEPAIQESGADSVAARSVLPAPVPTRQSRALELGTVGDIFRASLSSDDELALDPFLAEASLHMGMVELQLPPGGEPSSGPLLPSSFALLTSPASDELQRPRGKIGRRLGTHIFTRQQMNTAAPQNLSVSISAVSDAPAAVACSIRGVEFRDAAMPPDQSTVRQVPVAAAAAEASQKAGVGRVKDEAEILDSIMDEVSAVLGFGVQPSESLVGAGLDSIGAVELRNKLQSLAGCQLPAVVVFDYPSPSALASYLSSVDAQASAVAARALPSAATIDSGPGISAACSLEVVSVSNVQPWNAAYNSRDIISPVPLSRWDHSNAVMGRVGHQPGGFYTSAGGWLQQPIHEFDGDLYAINVGEAAVMDPQQRLLLEQGHQVLAEAHHHIGTAEAEAGLGERIQSPHTMATSGVFVGIGGACDFSTLCNLHGVPATSYSATGIIPSVASGRVSYVLGLQGPSLSVDTACSSSLVATHQAAEALKRRQTGSAVAAGVLLVLVPSSTFLLHLGGILSAEGRCKVLDSSTDGYVRGEDAAAFFLRRQDGYDRHHPVAAQLLSSAVNNDGASSSLTAPYGPAQKALLEAALVMGELGPHSLDACHLSCNGSNLGDVIEVNAVSEVLLANPKHLTGVSKPPTEPRAPPFVMLSIKSTTGHQEAASGIAVASAMANIIASGRLPPMLHLRTINPHVSQTLPSPTLGRGQASSMAALEHHGDRDVLLPRTSGTAWPDSFRGTPPCSGINSFGMQGTNAHVCLSGASSTAAATRPTGTLAATARLSRRPTCLTKFHCWPVPPARPLADRLLRHVPPPRPSLQVLCESGPSTADLFNGLRLASSRSSIAPAGVLISAISSCLDVLAHSSGTHLLSSISFYSHLPSSADSFCSAVDLRTGRITVSTMNPGREVGKAFVSCEVLRPYIGSTGHAWPLLSSSDCQPPGVGLHPMLLPRQASRPAQESSVTSHVTAARPSVGAFQGMDTIPHPGEFEAACQLLSCSFLSERSEAKPGVLLLTAAEHVGITRTVPSTAVAGRGPNLSTSSMTSGEGSFRSQHMAAAGLEMRPARDAIAAVAQGLTSVDAVASSETSITTPVTGSMAPVLANIIRMGNEEDLVAFLQSMVMDTVEGILGVAVNMDENLYAAGMDSRAGMIPSGSPMLPLLVSQELRPQRHLPTLFPCACL